MLTYKSTLRFSHPRDALHLIAPDDFLSYNCVSVFSASVRRLVSARYKTFLMRWSGGFSHPRDALHLIAPDDFLSYNCVSVFSASVRRLGF